MLIIKLGQKIYEVSLVYLVVPQGKKMLEISKHKPIVNVKATRSNRKNSHWLKMG